MVTPTRSGGEERNPCCRESPVGCRGQSGGKRQRGQDTVGLDKSGLLAQGNGRLLAPERGAVQIILSALFQRMRDRMVLQARPFRVLPRMTRTPCSTRPLASTSRRTFRRHALRQVQHHPPHECGSHCGDHPAPLASPAIGRCLALLVTTIVDAVREHVCTSCMLARERVKLWRELRRARRRVDLSAVREHLYRSLLRWGQLRPLFLRGGNG